MKKDYKADWWLSCEDKEDGLTLKELALGLLFCAVVLGVSMGVLYIRGRYFGA